MIGAALEAFDEPTGQLAFVQGPTIVIDFDPENLANGAPSDDFDWSYEEEWGLFWGCYTAWPADFPCVVGQGCSEHWALVDLARELRERSWPVDGSLSRSSQLARAAARLGERELVAYLKRHASPAELSRQYGLVLR